MAFSDRHVVESFLSRGPEHGPPPYSNAWSMSRGAEGWLLVANHVAIAHLPDAEDVVYVDMGAAPGGIKGWQGKLHRFVKAAIDAGFHVVLDAEAVREA